jgi:hypothetical protein
MDMTGEMSAILSGRVEATIDYANSRKVIGVSNDKIEGDPCPLGKQNAFKKEEIEQFEEIGALDKVDEMQTSGVEETLDFGAPAAASAASDATQSKFLPPADISDTTNEIPVNTAPTDNLTSFVSESGATALEIMTEAPTEAEKIELDIPAAEDVIATAPTGVDNSLFETANKSTLEAAPAEPTAAAESAPADAQPAEATEESKIVAVTAISPELVKKILEGFAADVASYAKKRSEEAYKELSSAISHEAEPAHTAEDSLDTIPSQDNNTEVPSFDSAIMNDAISQIANIKTL